MNKYVVRTSLVWIGIVVIGIAVLHLYRSRKASTTSKANSSRSSDVQPVAEGPALAAAPQPANMPAMDGSSVGSSTQTPMQAPLTPVQITPQRMQRIGVTTGTVEY